MDSLAGWPIRHYSPGRGIKTNKTHSITFSAPSLSGNILLHLHPPPVMTQIPTIECFTFSSSTFHFHSRKLMILSQVKKFSIEWDLQFIVFLASAAIDCIVKIFFLLRPIVIILTWSNHKSMFPGPVSRHRHVTGILTRFSRFTSFITPTKTIITNDRSIEGKCKGINVFQVQSSTNL